MGLTTPLTRFGLVTDESQDRIFLVWTVHHVLYDGWSMQLLLEQVESLYWRGDCDTSAPFNGFVKYLKELGNDADEYWQSQLDGIEAPVFPPLPSPGYEPTSQDLLQHHIADLTWPGNDITASTAVRAAWAILAARYTQTSDVIFGATVTGRQAPVPYMERIAGPTFATVPIRKQAVDMISYEQTGLKRIRHIDSDAYHATQFQTLLVVQPASLKTARPAAERLFPEDPSGGDDELAGINTYALMLECRLEPDGMLLRMSFDPQVIETQQAQKMAWQFEEVLRQICEEDASEKLVKSVEAASHQDLAQIWRWNETVPPSLEGCVYELITQRVKEQPDRPAICAWDGQLTYGELDGLSSKVARFLLSLGAGPNVIIPICFEKSMWTPVAMLAAIKTGSTSAAVDPSQPEERLQSIMQQIQPRLILTSVMYTPLASRLVERVVTVDAAALKAMANPAPGQFIFPSINPDSGLYIAFTSGSTGSPKGAIITHGNFRSAIEYHSEMACCDRSTRLFDFSSYAFDAAWFNLLHALAAGACLCIPSDMQRKDDLAGSIEMLQANYALLTPSTTRTLDPKTIPSLKTLMLIGEAVTSEDVQRWAPNVILKNGYGPAECSALSTIHTFRDPDDHPNTIGVTVGLQPWVVEPLDGASLTPLGAIGELWIEGPLVGAGYLGDPDKTAATFISDPAWLLRGPPSRPGQGRRGRLYKTGDLVRYNSDGSLAYIGRKDTQVKIRGQRVELEEIECHLRQRIFGETTGIVAADIITLRGSSSPTLVAYIALGKAATGTPPSVRKELSRYTEGLEEFLSDRLPSYMVPNLFVPVVEIPLSTTGKTDRRRLRQQGSSLSSEELLELQPSRLEKRAPQTKLEHRLQHLWAEVLNIDISKIGVDDTFFSLGGDSISAMQLSAKSRSIGCRITVSDIFKLKTIARLAHSGNKTEDLAVNETEKLDADFTLAPIQKFFFDSQPVIHGHFNQSFLVRISKPQSPEFILRGIRYIVDRHSMLRARFHQDTDGRWSQRITPSTDRSYFFETHNVASLEDAIPALTTLQQSLNIQTGPLFGAHLIEVEDKQYLFLVAHHLVVDLVSWRIMLGDVEEYLTDPTRSTLPNDAPLSFQTWCQLQASYAKDHLSPETALPFNLEFPRTDYWGLDPLQNTHENILERGFTLPKPVTDILLGAANLAFQTQPVELFQAALLHSFMQVFDDRAPATILTEGHGREPWNSSLDLSRTVGWFTTIAPTVVTANSDLSVAEIIIRTKDARRQTPGNGWPYFTSRYLNAAGKEAFGTSDCHEIVFNYFGLYQQLEKKNAFFQPCKDLDGKVPDVAGNIYRFAVIDVEAEVIHGCLRFNFQHSRHMEKQPALCRWITQCQSTLEAAAEQLAILQPRYTVSDFPLLPPTNETRRKLDALKDFGISFGEVEDIYPCSPVQQGILLSQAKDPNLYWTRVRWLVQSDETVDVQRLVRAWCQVVARHATLRAIFTGSFVFDGYNDQIVLKQASPPIQVMSARNSTEAVAALAEYQKTAVQQKDLLHRFVLCPTLQGAVYCQLDINHALIDAISMKTIKQDLRAAYDDNLPAQPAPLYSDYVQHIQTVSESETRLYWQSRVAGAEPCIFPTLNETPTDLRGIASEPITEEIYQSLRTFSRIHGLTPSSVFHLAWGLVLRCYTSTESVCFASLSSGRDVPVEKADSIVGPFINVLVNHARLVSGRPLLSMMQDQQADYLEGLKYQHYPLAEVLHILNADSEPYFNTALSVQSGGLNEDTQAYGISLDDETWDDPNEYDIATTVFLRKSNPKVSINYSLNLLSEAQAATVASTFLEAVRAMITRPETNVEDLQII
ncbi:acetyl-CoA synthetase-like protein, partial [Aspergillus steynii IBT 23096]